MTMRHTTDQISDYVLDLLPSAERRTLEDHAAVCTLCRSEIEAERALALTVRGTLAALPQPSLGRIAALQPAYKRPQTRPAFAANVTAVLSMTTLRHGIATLILAAGLLFILAGLQGGGIRSAEASPVPMIAATVHLTATAMPSATPTELAMFNQLASTPTPTNALAHNQ